MPGRRSAASRWRSPRRVVLVVLALVAVAVTVRVLANSAGELSAAADQLVRVAPAWVASAMAAEGLSYLSYGVAQRALLRGGGARVGLAPVAALSVAGQAAANCVPGGLGVSAVVTYRQLRRRGVGDSLCGVVLLVTSVLYVTALALLAVLGVQLAGGQTAVPGLQAVGAGVVVAVAVVIGLLVALRRRSLRSRLLARLAGGLDALGRRFRSRRPWGGPVRRLSRVSLPAGALASASLALTACWVADGLCLALSFYAVGASPPWRGLLLSYCAAQLAATLPITPGGLGVVEGSLTLALVAFGGEQDSTLAAVLLYRLVSFWGIIPAGGLCYLLVRRTGGRQPVPPTRHRMTEEAA